MLPLRIDNLNKTFTSGWLPFGPRTSFTAVNNVSFELGQGEILGLLGPNGAGKTTIIQMLLGVLKPTSGNISYFGQDFFQHEAAIMKKVAHASGYDKLPGRLTVHENLVIFSRLYGVRQPMRNEKIKELLTFFGIWDLRDKATASLSAGQSTRVMLTKAFLSDPQIVLLDEPTAALDPDVSKEVRAFILEQRKQRGVSVLFTSHNMDEVTELCDRVLILKQGSIIANNTPEKLAATVKIAKVHLVITQGLDCLIKYLGDQHFKFVVHGHEIEIEVEETGISKFLTALAQQEIEYAQVSIDKPSLEDYFLTIMNKSK